MAMVDDSDIDPMELLGDALQQERARIRREEVELRDALREIYDLYIGGYLKGSDIGVARAMANAYDVLRAADERGK